MAVLTPFGKTVRKLRIDADCTMADMAEALGVTPAYLSAVEVGRKPVNDRLVEKAVDFFDRRLDNFDRGALIAAADRTRDSVDVSCLSEEQRQGVAAFARRLKNPENPEVDFDLDDLRKLLEEG